MSHFIGVISDTHGLMRPEALKALEGVERIIHAGDVGKPEVLAALEKIAPVTAVRGNVDTGPWAAGLHQSEVVILEDTLLYVIHKLEDLPLDPAASGFAAVITGHSHHAHIESRGGILYLNPGSAGPQRFSLPITLAHLFVDDAGKLDAQLITLA